MSRAYDMYITIKDFDQSRHEEIIQACKKEWDFEIEFFENDDFIDGSGCGNLCGGETEEEFSTRVKEAIFKANGKSCTVKIDAESLDDELGELFDDIDGIDPLDDEDYDEDYEEECE